ncbi:hypothetical protein [Pistricoccus aurantiacus]|uniref:hypothetical protein n=1 Tax=Pistricoccus aurantiacus TaxID=1883414 RepID=UPI0016457384|nr:hypothetical protein [Pistricoccus aurantiacus]
MQNNTTHITFENVDADGLPHFLMNHAFYMPANLAAGDALERRDIEDVMVEKLIG